MKVNFWKIIRFGLLAVGIALLVWVYQPAKYLPPRVKEAIVLATTKKPETFTELYFQNHLGLPSRVIPNHQYSFAFTIHNLEHKDMDYPYEIYIEQGGEKQYLDKNSVSVKDNETITIQQGFVLNKPVSRAKVVINLTSKNQQIDFWMEEQ